MTPKRTIGILITTYNSTAFLSEALESISLQTRKPDQVILVDDCSTDATPKLVADWAKIQPFEVLQLSNQRREGIPAVGRDLGLRAASTSLLAFLDHDDLMAAHNLATLSTAFDTEPGLVLAFSDAAEFYAVPGAGRSFLHGKQIEKLPYRESPSGFRILTGDVFESLMKGSYVPTMTCLWDRQAALDVGGFSREAGTADDGHLWMRLALKGKIGYFPLVLGYKRTHGDNLSHPRNALEMGRDLRTCILSIVQEKERWNLTPKQIAASLTTIEELNETMRYHASRRGLKDYRSTLQLIGDEKLHPKELLVSILRSIGAPRF